MITSVARNQRLCSLCNGRPSGSAGEHVIPQWFIKSVFGPAPFSRWFGNEQEVDRDNELRHHSTYPVIKLDCCKDCNDTLSNHFEVNRGVVERFFVGRELIGHPESKVLSEWMLKTILLLSHPRAEWDINAAREAREKIQQIRTNRWSHVPSGFFDWVIGRASAPEGLSLFVHMVDKEAEPIESPLVVLPEVHADGHIYRCDVAMIELASVGLTLIYHPGWKFIHPLDEEPAIVRVWPTPQDLQPALMTPFRDWPVRFVTSTHVHFEAGSFNPSGFLDLTETTEFYKIPGVCRVDN